MYSVLLNYLWLIWLIAFALLIIFEAVTVNLVTLWLGMGAFCAGMAALLGIPPVWQVVVFAVISTLCIVLLRPLTQRYVRVKSTKTNVNSVLGSAGVVTEVIKTTEKGKVRLSNGQIWTATGADGSMINKDTVVVVEKVEGVTLFVKTKSDDEENQTERS